MNIKQSLEENKAEILKNLPEEFHADFEKNLQDAPEKDAIQSVSEVQKEVAAALPEDLKKDADDISSEISEGAPVGAASKEEEKAAILAALPDDLKAEFEKNWKG
ncbi:MAG: hypothetical protein AAFQ94_05450 [Bacteroidota bacterium]